MRRQAGLAALAAAAALAGCGRDTCLEPGERCDRLETCGGLAFGCADPTVRLVHVRDLPGGLDLAGADGVGDDFVLQNGAITAVIDALGSPHDLAPTGGTIIDLGPRGGADALTSIYQIAGILPDDAFAYTDAEVQTADDRVALIVRGALDGRPEVKVVTRYELRACEPGLRIRSELENGTPDVQTFVLADAAHWGKRDALPFSPAPGQGFLAPELDLLKLGETYSAHAYVAARPAGDDGPTYGFVACDRDQLEGVNDPEISALGTGLEVVRPGESLVLERFVVATGGRDLAEGVRTIANARTMLHGDPPAVTVHGRVVSGGVGFGGTARRAAVLLAEDAGGGLERPLTMVVPAADGGFTAQVPATGAVRYHLWSFGREVASGAADPSGDAGTIEVAAPATLVVTVDLDGAPAFATLAFDPADAATRAAVTGSWFGRQGGCAPWLGPAFGGSPACNRAIVTPAGVDVEVPAGHYEVYASAGPDASLARAELTLVAGETSSVALALARLPTRPPGWLAADLHVHGQGSFDSSLPDRDRVLTFVASGVDVIASTDHDFISDYAGAIADAGIGDRVVVMGGLESTGLIPFLAVPGDDLPRVIGHFNHWPLTPDPAEPRGGAPFDEKIEPGELFDIVDPLMGPAGLSMLNHPWDEPQSGRDLGFLRAIHFDPRVPIPPAPDGSRNGMLLDAPLGGHRNIDFDVIEVENGGHAKQVIKTRPLWFSLLDQGFVRAGAANSDSHSLVDAQLGYGRTLCAAGVGLADFTPAAFNRAVVGGECVGGNGVVVQATIGKGVDRRAVGLAPYVPPAGATLEIEIRAAPWIPVDVVRVVTSKGERILASGKDLVHPRDPYGTADVVRWRGSVAVADLVPPGHDDWIVIEAGLPFFATADLDDDGVPDTSDRNGDGIVDHADVKDPSDDSGPLESPPDPTDPRDPRFAMTRIVPEAWPYGFANPFLIDWAGDGWDPPGLPGGR